MIFRLYFKDNDFEIESKYHCKTVVVLLIAHILSLQDVVLRSMFFSYILLNCLLVMVFGAMVDDEFFSTVSGLHFGKCVISTRITKTHLPPTVVYLSF